MNYKDFFKSNKNNSTEIKNLIPEGVSTKEFYKGVSYENKELDDKLTAAKIASKHLMEDKNFYSKVCESFEEDEEDEEEQDEYCGDHQEEGVENIADMEGYDDNDGMPMLGGALAVKHQGQPISLGKIVQVGGINNRIGSATGELSGMTSISSTKKGVAPDTGGLTVNSCGDKETITAGGKKVDTGFASKTVGGNTTPGEGQKQGGPHVQGTIASTSKLNEGRNKIKSMIKDVLKEIKFDEKKGKWVKVEENCHMKMGPSYKVVQPKQYKTEWDSAARKNQYDPQITEMYDDEEECNMNERYVELANAKRNLSESELKELNVLREKIDSISENKMEYNMKPTEGESKYVDFDEKTGMWCIFGSESGFAYKSFASEEEAKRKLKSFSENKKWIQKAVNPDHKGFCSPMTKSTCTPHRKALAKRFKSGDLSEDMEEEESKCCENYPKCEHVNNMDEDIVSKQPNYELPNWGAQYTVRDGATQVEVPGLVNHARQVQKSPRVNEVGGMATQKKSYRTSNDLPQNPKARWANNVEESKNSSSEVFKKIRKGMKSKKKNNNLKFKPSRRTTSGVNKRK